MMNELQVADFWKDGFVVIDDVLTPAEVEELRAAADNPIVRQGLRDGGFDERCVHLLEITAKHEAFKKLAMDERIVAPITQLIGDDVQLQHSKLATKPPKQGAGAFEWHQDYAYYPHTNYDLVSVMVMLDDATPENGGMYAVKGSHKLGMLNHERDGWFSEGCQERQYWENHPEWVVPLMARAGGISIHHCLTLHGSPANASGLPRRGVVFSYRAGHAYQLADEVWVDTGFQVHGTASGLVKCAEMNVKLPRYRRRLNQFGEPYGGVYAQTGEYAVRWNEQLRAHRERQRGEA